jgi:tetratricopeptide (TPR) repeat protein
LAVFAVGSVVSSGVLAEPNAAGDLPPLFASQLGTQARRLLGPEPGGRAETAHRLSHLDSEAREPILARMHALSVERPLPDEVSRVLNSLRRAAGAHSPDDDVDLALAVPALLARERTADVLAVVEPLLYLRSLETMSGGEGLSDLALFVELDGGVWENELKLVRKRVGASWLPALIALRAHENKNIRRFAIAQLAALGADDPKFVVSGADPYVIARAIRAYASPPDYAAMPVIVRLLGDSRIQVRQAARAAISRFGKNAIWQLRALYDEVSGQPADKRWDYERTARELYDVLDRPRVEEADTLQARGLQSLTRGDLAAMQRDYDALLAKYPDFERRDRLAPGYAALADDLFQRDALEAALSAYRRAVRLAPDAPDAKRWTARVAFVSAELSLTRGVVDLTSYARALSFDPGLTAARDAIERLSGTRTQHARDMKRLAALVAFVLLLACVALLVRRTPRTDRTDSVANQSTSLESESEQIQSHE